MLESMILYLEQILNVLIFMIVTLLFGGLVLKFIERNW